MRAMMFSVALTWHNRHLPVGELRALAVMFLVALTGHNRHPQWGSCSHWLFDDVLVGNRLRISTGMSLLGSRSLQLWQVTRRTNV